MLRSEIVRETERLFEGTRHERGAARAERLRGDGIGPLAPAPQGAPPPRAIATAIGCEQDRERARIVLGLGDEIGGEVAQGSRSHGDE